MFWAVVAIAVVLFIACAYFYNEWRKCQSTVPQEPTSADLKKLKEYEISVGNLYKILFMAAGTVVSPSFNALWRTAGLTEKGVPDITNGRT